VGEITTIGLDLAKSIFQAYGADAAGGVVLRRKLRRGASILGIWHGCMWSAAKSGQLISNSASARARPNWDQRRNVASAAQRAASMPAPPSTM
jgi:hypothetical protein